MSWFESDAVKNALNSLTEEQRESYKKIGISQHAFDFTKDYKLNFDEKIYHQEIIKGIKKSLISGLDFDDLSDEDRSLVKKEIGKNIITTKDIQTWIGNDT